MYLCVRNCVLLFTIFKCDCCLQENWQQCWAFMLQVYYYRQLLLQTIIIIVFQIRVIIFTVNLSQNIFMFIKYEGNT